MYTYSVICSNSDQRVNAMAVKVLFEIGHTAKLKSKKTPEGFTHDWELYVRGLDKNDVSQFVEKVVFHLHESFPKPKRTSKEAPYVLKESGYAGFVLPIDIHFKNRDEQKRVTFTYDLDLQNTGPPVHRSVIKKHIFNNPSDEFKQKLLKGGGILLMNYDEKSRDSTDERSQVVKPKLTNDAIKKHKIRPEDSKMQTFATLFGPPITKTTTKVSPDAKSKGSPSLIQNNKGISKTTEKSASVSSAPVKEKNEKGEKKDKHRRSSPHRERDSSKDGKRIISNEEKHEKKEEKNKEKTHSKDRERSKDRALKRPPSPKRIPSPKRPSPPRSLSSTRGEEIVPKPMVKSELLEGKKSSSNSGKKSKKEKKSYEKDKDRERKERDRERKDKDDRSNSSNPPLALTPSSLSQSTSIAQIKGNSEKTFDAAKKADSGQLKEMKKVDTRTSENSNSEKKTMEKHDKDSEKKHKHKKKEKSKEKDKDLPSKEKKKDKNNKQKDEIKKITQAASQLNEPVLSTQQKVLPILANNPPVSKLSDQETSESENESLAPPASEPKSNNNHSDTSNSSFPDLVLPKPAIPHFEETKSEKKEHKSREKVKPEKDGKKRKRKVNKDEQEQFSRKSVSPVVSTQAEPPPKQFKKDDFIKVDNKVSSPVISATNSSSNQSIPQDASPRISSNSPVFRTPSSAPIPMALPTNNSNERNSINVDYMSELRELQHKIMTLQDNNELQQVVEMIAATGRFEVTSKTFDFDLCALDRTTVQRLQDFLATSVS